MRELRKSIIIHIFSPSGIYIATVKSGRMAAGLTGILPQAISNAANGLSNNAGGYYFRHDNEKVDISVFDDLGVMTVKDYDKQAGVVGRKYPSPRDISNKRSVSFANTKIVHGKEK